MPYTAEHKQRTREKIVAAARLLFNERGFVDVSIDDVMAEAGLTRGGFYNHFSNKEDLLLASVEAYEQCNPADAWDGVELDYAAEANELAQQMIRAYLSNEHLRDVAGHCPLVALPADASRAGPAVRDAYRRLLEKMIYVFAEADGVDEDTALALTALCIGAMLIGRTTTDTRFSERMLSAARGTGTQLLESCATTPRPRRRLPKDNRARPRRPASRLESQD
ncbi:MAG: TetR/AcrR family transcriptional regulator [Woeseiaceae bacterium]|nr:TetR/AcrR family transcriptional regulator [Woeseiaceae bacterium]